MWTDGGREVPVHPTCPGVQLSGPQCIFFSLLSVDNFGNHFSLKKKSERELRGEWLQYLLKLDHDISEIERAETFVTEGEDCEPNHDVLVVSSIAEIHTTKIKKPDGRIQSVGWEHLCP